MKDRLFPQERHESQRGHFAAELYEHMAKDERIWLITAGLGYGMFTHHFKDFPERSINTEASEQAALGIAIGLSDSHKIPCVYSITNFLIYRPFELIHNYLEHEGANVKLIGSGRDYDYAHDGWSHHSPDAKTILDAAFPHVVQFWPEDKLEIPNMVSEMLANDRPCFVSLRR